MIPNWILNNAFIQSLLKYGLIALAAIGLIKAVRKDAADDRETEIRAQDDEIAIKLLKEAKEAHEESDNISDDDLAERLS